jgi:hypothetical protein
MPKPDTGDTGPIVADCLVRAGEVAVLVDDRLMLEDGSEWPVSACDYEQGATIRIYYTEPSRRQGRATRRDAVDSDDSEVAMEPTPTPTAPIPAPPVEAAPAPAPVEAAPAAAPAPVETTATTAEPATPSADDLAKLTEAAGGNAGLAALLAIVAVAGSAGAMKLYKGWSDNRKEIELAKIEASKAPDYSTQQPPPCAVKAAETEARLAGLTSKLGDVEDRIAKVEKKAGSLPVGFDADELEERIVKIEKALKAKKA